MPRNYESYAIFYCYSIQGDRRHTFRGDRTNEDIVGFAVRMAAPPVQHLASQHELIGLTERPGHLFFLYAGIQEGPLWVSLNFTLEIVTSLPFTLIGSLGKVFANGDRYPFLINFMQNQL